PGAGRSWDVEMANRPVSRRAECGRGTRRLAIHFQYIRPVDDQPSGFSKLRLQKIAGTPDRATIAITTWVYACRQVESDQEPSSRCFAMPAIACSIQQHHERSDLPAASRVAGRPRFFLDEACDIVPHHIHVVCRPTLIELDIVAPESRTKAEKWSLFGKGIS